MVEHWYSVVYVADDRCATIIQIHHLFVKFLNIPHCIRNFKEQFSTGSKKIPLLVRTFRSNLSTSIGKLFSYTSRKNIQIRTLLNIFFDPFFQGVLCHNINGWLFIFQVIAGEKDFLSIVLLKWQPPKTNLLCVFRLHFFKIFLPVVADEKGNFRSISRINFKKIILPKLDRILKTNFPTNCRELKIPLLTKVGRSGIKIICSQFAETTPAAAMISLASEEVMQSKNFWAASLSFASVLVTSTKGR